MIVRRYDVVETGEGIFAHLLNNSAPKSFSIDLLPTWERRFFISGNSSSKEQEIS